MFVSVNFTNYLKAKVGTCCKVSENVTLKQMNRSTGSIMVLWHKLS